MTSCLFAEVYIQLGFEAKVPEASFSQLCGRSNTTGIHELCGIADA